MKDWYLMYVHSGESYSSNTFVGRTTKEEDAIAFLKSSKLLEPYEYGKVTKITDKEDKGYYL